MRGILILQRYVLRWSSLLRSLLLQYVQLSIHLLPLFLFHKCPIHVITLDYPWNRLLTIQGILINNFFWVWQRTFGLNSYQLSVLFHTNNLSLYLYRHGFMSWFYLESLSMNLPLSFGKYIKSKRTWINRTFSFLTKIMHNSLYLNIYIFLHVSSLNRNFYYFRFIDLCSRFWLAQLLSHLLVQLEFILNKITFWIISIFFCINIQWFRFSVRKDLYSWFFLLRHLRKRLITSLRNYNLNR